MVVLLFLLTVIFFIAIDFFLKKEERAIKSTHEEKKSPIFLSPEKALKKLELQEERLFHLSHSWIQEYNLQHYYAGFDNFITTLFSSDINIGNLPKVGSYVQQGNKIWDIYTDGHTISQLSPISGTVIEVNPACNIGIPLPSEQVEKSWILKIKRDSQKNEFHNLISHHQAHLINSVLKDELLLSAQEAHFLNDGGKIDPAFIEKLPENEWKKIIQKFFPYMGL